jgi:DNA excision repair protein ERCC-6
MIRDFITTHGGSVYTQNLIDHFNRYCTTPQKSAVFKEMLKQIAVLDKGGRNGRGRWQLKPEYVKRR